MRLVPARLAKGDAGRRRLRLATERPAAPLVFEDALVLFPTLLLLLLAFTSLFSLLPCLELVAVAPLSSFTR